MPVLPTALDRRSDNFRANGAAMALLRNWYELANLGNKQRPKAVRIRSLESKDIRGWNQVRTLLLHERDGIISQD